MNLNEQFRNCVNTANFNNDNDINIDQMMSVIIRDVDNDMDVSYRWGDMTDLLTQVSYCLNLKPCLTIMTIVENLLL